MSSEIFIAFLIKLSITLKLYHLRIDKSELHHRVSDELSTLILKKTDLIAEAHSGFNKRILSLKVGETITPEEITELLRNSLEYIEKNKTLFEIDIQSIIDEISIEIKKSLFKLSLP